MKKFIRPSLFLISFLICYFIILFMLKKVDPQPDWGIIAYPEAVVAGKDINITLEYKDIKSPLQLFFELTYQDRNEIYCGQKNYTDSIPIIQGNGKIHQSLVFNPPDSVYRVRISTSLYQLPPKPGVSIYRCKLAKQALISEWIYVSKNGLLPQGTKLSNVNFLKQGYQNGYWKVEKGDSSVMGWFITCYYLFVFILSFYLIKKIAPHIKNKKYLWFWYGVIILIMMIGINKQLDIQMLLADYARLYAKMSGIFQNRKPFQHKIISLLATIGISIFFILIYKLWHAPKITWFALIGFSILFSFPLIRLVSLHRIESLLYVSVLSIKVVDVLEIIGISIVFIAIIMNYFAYKNGNAKKILI